MSAAVFIYAAEVLNNLGVLLFFFGLFGLIGAAIFTAVSAMENGKYHHRNWTFIAPTICLCIAMFIPSSKTMYMMAGTMLGEKAVQSEIGQKVVSLLETKLDEELEKLKGKK